MVSALAGRRVVLGVSGGIAAYKAVELCRRLVDVGAFVSPILTADATRFVGEVTFSALASERARTGLFDDPSDPIPHTRLGQSADVVVVAPATAKLIGKYVAGISDDLLTATLLATRAPVVVCPAMHTEMWDHAAVQDNVAVLRRRGVTVVDPAAGRLAGGDMGAGRLPDVEVILAAVERALTLGDLEGLNVLVTAGGTREPIDAVRVITNRSSGRQGHALAEEAAARGAKVTLVTTADRAVPADVEVVRVSTAAEMEAEVVPRAGSADVVIMAAAVADFRPADAPKRKIKKRDARLELALEPTHDFLVDLGQRKRPGQLLVGFAAETEDLRANALDKLERKGLDLIAANDVSAPGAGFEHETNTVLLLGRDGFEREISLRSKRDVARSILDEVSARLGRTPEGGTQ